MNFLAHHLLRRGAGSAWFSTGLLLPDLRGHAGRGARLAPAAIAAAVPRSEPERELRAGLIEHARDDAAFHGSRAFSAWRAALRPAAAGLGLAGGVGSLVIHVGIEVALDRLLLLAVPDLAASLYRELEPVDGGVLGAALAHLAGEPARPLAGAFEQFRARRHLLAWTDPGRAAEALRRVCEAMVADPARRPGIEQTRAFLAEAERALLASRYAPTAIAEWIGAGAA